MAKVSDRELIRAWHAGAQARCENWPLHLKTRATPSCHEAPERIDEGVDVCFVVI
jgi:hypothetical protein